MMCATRGSSRLLCTGSAVPGGPDGQSLVPAVYRLCQHATIKTECAGGGGAAAGVDATAGGAPIVRVIRLRQAFCTMLQCALPIGAGPGLLLRFALHRGLSAAARRRHPPARKDPGAAGPPSLQLPALCACKLVHHLVATAAE